MNERTEEKKKPAEPGPGERRSGAELGTGAFSGGRVKPGKDESRPDADRH
ncbi:MAG: hypothetical protein M3N07_00915 [Pseudomonadota bacterium]|nr:hypothetical protein [Pseudomonadota bacterium]